MALFSFLRRRFLSFRKQAVVLWYAFRDPRTPFHLKIASLAVGLYLISPIDLIPFTVPFLGVVDDLVIVPLGVGLIAKRLPDGVYSDAGRRADLWVARYFKRPLLTVAIILATLFVIWAAGIVLLYRVLFS